MPINLPLPKYAWLINSIVQLIRTPIMNSSGNTQCTHVKQKIIIIIIIIW